MRFGAEEPYERITVKVDNVLLAPWAGIHEAQLWFVISLFDAVRGLEW